MKDILKINSLNKIKKIEFWVMLRGKESSKSFKQDNKCHTLVVCFFYWDGDKVKVKY